METTTTTLGWAMLLLAKHQEIQCRVQQELDKNIDNNASITLKDREKLPYTGMIKVKAEL